MPSHSIVHGLLVSFFSMYLLDIFKEARSLFFPFLMSTIDAEPHYSAIQVAHDRGTSCPKLDDAYPWLTRGRVTWEEADYAFAADRMEGITSASVCALEAYNWISHTNELVKLDPKDVPEAEITRYNKALVHRQVLGTDTLTEAYYTFHKHLASAPGGVQCWVWPGCDQLDTSGNYELTDDRYVTVSGHVKLDNPKSKASICTIEETRPDCLTSLDGTKPSFCTLAASEEYNLTCTDLMHLGLTDYDALTVDEKLRQFCYAYDPTKTGNASVPSDCMCVGRELLPLYNVLMSSNTFAASSDFCWWLPCKQREVPAFLVSNQMRVDRSNVSCTVRSCEAAINISESENIIINGTIDQVINCNFGESTGQATTTSSTDTDNSDSTNGSDDDLELTTRTLQSTIKYILIVGGAVLVIGFIIGLNFLLKKMGNEDKRTNGKEDSSAQKAVPAASEPVVKEKPKPNEKKKTKSLKVV